MALDTARRFCSRSCCGKAYRATEVGRLSARLAQRKHRLHNRPAALAKQCAECNAEFVGNSRRVFCSTQCRMDHNRAQSSRRFREWYHKDRTPLPSLPCAECGVQFSPTLPHMTHCSDECRRKRHWRVWRSVRRSRLKGATIETVDPIKVFDRDGWRCHLCSELTDRSKRGSSHPNAPELDHVMPLSKGGEHSYANTACAHRKCNRAKSNRIIGQPSLLVA